jgi:hypothetical protein
MKMNKAALALAIASSFGAMSGAQAAVDLAKGTGILKIAKEFSLQNTEPFRNDGAVSNRLVVKIPAVKGYSVNTNNGYFVKITLLDGATFAGDAKLTCTTSNGGIKALNITQFGKEDDTTVTFSLDNTTPQSLHATSACSLSVGGAIASDTTAFYTITNKTDQRMSAVIEYQDGLTSKTTGMVGTFISFATGLTFSAGSTSIKGGASNTNVPADATVDVQQASLKFDANTKPGTNTAFIGSVIYKAGGNVTYSPTTTTVVDVADILQSASITVNSPALVGIGSVTLTTDGADNLCAGTSIKSVSPSGNTSVTFNAITPAQLKGGINICIVADGLTNIPAGQFSVTANGTGTLSGTVEKAVPNFGAADQLLHNLKKNGSSHRVLNIPPAGVADKAYIRLYNVSGFSGTVLGTMRDAAGALIGSQGIVVATLAPREVKVINADNLKTLFGDWTGRSRLFLEADINELRVQSLMRSSDVLENMSGQAVD